VAQFVVDNHRPGPPEGRPHDDPQTGTPQSAAMHVIERYRPIDGALAKAGQDKHEKVQGVVRDGGRESGAGLDAGAKGLRLELTMEAPNVFTAPLPR
jgi:hypothetical protein